jgi:uncharacterized protein YjbI with pentapeptide repeats
MKAIRKASLPWIVLFSLILFFAVVVWTVPQRQAQQIANNPEKRLELENAARSTLLQVLGGAFFFVTAYFTWRNFQVSEGKEITGRLSKAVEMLSHEKTHIRLGGIHLLERIAKDSPEDNWVVMKILCSYIRLESSLRGDREAKAEPRIPEDIQAAFSVIVTRRISNDPPGFSNRMLDLRRVNLNGIEIDHADLSYLKLDGSDLTNSSLLYVRFHKHLAGAVHEGEIILRNSDLRLADISETTITKIDLANSDLSEASFLNSNLWNVNLSKCKLWGTNFKFYRNLTNVNLSGATYTQETIFPEDFEPEKHQMYLIKTGTILSKLDLDNLNLRNADLVGANLSGSDLSGCNLKYAQLSKANLSRAKLNGADLDYANLSDSNLDGVDLSNASLNDADLCGAILKNITWNENTSWIKVKNLSSAKEIPDQLRKELRLTNIQTQSNNPNAADG